MVTIISTHPWQGSLNVAISNKLADTLDNRGEDYRVINLPEDGFDPNYTEGELSLYNKGEILDPLIMEYQQTLKKTSHLILIFPIWWGTMPAILKGFFDKVMTLNFAFNYENGWTPLLTNIKKTTIITTSQGDTEMFRNSIENCFCKQMLEGVGSTNNVWYNRDKISELDKEKVTEFIDSIKI